jgi:hypothetical protein
MFGLSRGAYTVRCIAGMINNCGIIRRRGMSGASLNHLLLLPRMHAGPVSMLCWQGDPACPSPDSMATPSVLDRDSSAKHLMSQPCSQLHDCTLAERGESHSAQLAANSYLAQRQPIQDGNLVLKKCPLRRRGAASGVLRGLCHLSQPGPCLQPALDLLAEFQGATEPRHPGAAHQIHGPAGHRG